MFVAAGGKVGIWVGGFEFVWVCISTNGYVRLR